MSNGFLRVPGTLVTLQPKTLFGALTILKASVSSHSQLRAGFLSSLGLFRSPFPGKTSRPPYKLASWTALPGPVSRRITLLVGLMSPTTSSPIISPGPGSAISSPMNSVGMICQTISKRYGVSQWIPRTIIASIGTGGLTITHISKASL